MAKKNNEERRGKIATEIARAREELLGILGISRVSDSELSEKIIVLMDSDNREVRLLDLMPMLHMNG